MNYTNDTAEALSNHTKYDLIVNATRNTTLEDLRYYEIMPSAMVWWICIGINAIFIGFWLYLYLQYSRYFEFSLKIVSERDKPVDMSSQTAEEVAEPGQQYDIKVELRHRLDPT